MLDSTGKLMIYSSDRPSPERLRIVGSAVAKVADALSLDTEVSSRSKLLSIYVYYKSQMGEEIPVYCDWGKRWKEGEVSRAIKNMMFVLSFHPGHAALRNIRKKVCLSA